MIYWLSEKNSRTNVSYSLLPIRIGEIKWVIRFTSYQREQEIWKVSYTVLAIKTEQEGGIVSYD